MIVRCGACRTQFEVQGAGRFACPSCGSLNVVRGAGGAAPPPPPPGGYGPQTGMTPPPAPPPPPRPDPPSPRVSCPECDFGFIVGRIATASCPNCGAEVDTGWSDEESVG